MSNCLIQDCTEKYHAKGFCLKHYKRWKRNGNAKKMPRIQKICIVEGCGKLHFGKGFCPKHFYSYKTYGDPLSRKRKFKIHCRIKDCQNRQGLRMEGLCASHYVRWRATRKKCLVAICKRPSISKDGYCRKHWYRWKNYGIPEFEIIRTRLCAARGCSRPYYARGKCYWHYLKLTPPAKIKLCSVEGCKNIFRAKGFCAKHYVAARKKIG